MSQLQQVIQQGTTWLSKARDNPNATPAEEQQVGPALGRAGAECCVPGKGLLSQTADRRYSCPGRAQAWGQAWWRACSASHRRLNPLRARPALLGPSGSLPACPSHQPGVHPMQIRTQMRQTKALLREVMAQLSGGGSEAGSHPGSAGSNPAAPAAPVAPAAPAPAVPPAGAPAAVAAPAAAAPPAPPGVAAPGAGRGRGRWYTPPGLGAARPTYNPLTGMMQPPQPQPPLATQQQYVPGYRPPVGHPPAGRGPGAMPGMVPPAGRGRGAPAGRGGYRPPGGSCCSLLQPACLLCCAPCCTVQLAPACRTGRQGHPTLHGGSFQQGHLHCLPSCPAAFLPRAPRCPLFPGAR